MRCSDYVSLFVARTTVVGFSVSWPTFVQDEPVVHAAGRTLDVQTRYVDDHIGGFFWILVEPVILVGVAEMGLCTV